MLTEITIKSPWATATEFIKAGYNIQHKEAHTRNRSDGFFIGHGLDDTFYHDNLVKYGSEYIPTHDMQND